MSCGRTSRTFCSICRPASVLAVAEKVLFIINSDTSVKAFGGDVSRSSTNLDLLGDRHSRLDYLSGWHPSDQPISPKAKSRTLLTRTSKVFFATATARMTGFLLLPQCDSILLSSWASFCTATCCRSDAGPDGRSLVESDIPTILRQIWWCVVTLGKLHSLGKPQRQKFVSLLPEPVVHKPDVIRQLQKFVAS